MEQAAETKGNIVRHDAYHLIKDTQKRLRAESTRHKNKGGSRIDLYIYISFFMSFIYNEPTSPGFVQKFDASKDEDREPRPTVQKLYALANVLEDMRHGNIRMAPGRDDVLRAIVWEERRANAAVYNNQTWRKDTTKEATAVWIESVKKTNRLDWLQTNEVVWRKAET